MCELIGGWVEKGEYPNDEKALEKIVKGISYNNAVRYFGFDVKKFIQSKERWDIRLRVISVYPSFLMNKLS